MDTIADGQFPRVERTAVVVRAFCTPRTRQRPLCPRSSPEYSSRRASFRDSVGPFEVGVEPDGGPEWEIGGPSLSAVVSHRHAEGVVQMEPVACDVQAFGAEIDGR